MTTLLRKSEPSRELRRKVDQIVKRKKEFDARRYCGSVTFSEDALTIQRKLRAEWDGPDR